MIQFFFANWANLSKTSVHHKLFLKFKEFYGHRILLRNYHLLSSFLVCGGVFTFVIILVHYYEPLFVLT